MTSRMPRPIRRDIMAVLLLGLPLMLIIAAYYPGHGIADEIIQLTQARSGAFADWHPPIMSFLWRLTDRLWAGSGPLLIINQVFLTSGIYLVLRSFYRPLAAAALTAAMILAPPVLGVSGMIAKDAALGAFVALALGLTLLAQSGTGHRWLDRLLLSGAVVLLILATAARHNAVILATLVGYVVLRAGWARFRGFPPGQGDRLRVELGLLAVAAAFFCAVFAGTSLFNRVVLRAESQLPIQSVMIYDLAGMSVDRGVMLLDRSRYPAQNLEHLRFRFDTKDVSPIVGGRIGGAGNDLLDDPLGVYYSNHPEDLQRLANRWLTAVFDDPLGYLAVRLALFREILGLWTKDGTVCAPFYEAIDENDLGLAVQNPWLDQRLVAYLFFFRDTLINRVWLFALLNIAGLAVLSALPTTERERTVAIAGGAALLYLAAYFIIAPACEFRYVFPMVVITLLVTAVAGRKLYGRRLHRRRPAGRHDAESEPV